MRTEWVYCQHWGLSFAPRPDVLREHCERLRAEINSSAPEANPVGQCGEIARIWRAMEAMGGEVPPCPAWAVGLMERSADELLAVAPEWNRQDLRDALNAAIGWCAARGTEAPAMEAEGSSTEGATDWTDWDTGKRWATKLSISYDTLKRRMDRGEIVAERQGKRLRIARKHLS